MQQLNKHDVNKLTASGIKDRLPFVLVSDGEDIALVCDVNSVNDKPTPSPDVTGL